MDRLFAACRAGDRSAVAKALSEGAGVNAVLHGYSLISAAAAEGHEEVVRLLLQRGARVAFEDFSIFDRRCPFRTALINHHDTIALELVAAGAVVARTSRYDVFPLSKAVKLSSDLFRAVLSKYAEARANAASTRAGAGSIDADSDGKDLNAETSVLGDLVTTIAEDGVKYSTSLDAAAALLGAGLAPQWVVALCEGGCGEDVSLTSRIGLLVQLCNALLSTAATLPADVIDSVFWARSDGASTRTATQMLRVLAEFGVFPGFNPLRDPEHEREPAEARRALCALVKAFPSALAAANAKDDHGATVLDYLIRKGYANDSEFLQCVGLQHSYGGGLESLPALIAAIAEGDAAAVKRLLRSHLPVAERTVLVGRQDVFGMSLVHYAAGSGNIEIMDAVLACCAGPELNLWTSLASTTIEPAKYSARQRGEYLLLEAVTPLGAALIEFTEALLQAGPSFPFYSFVEDDLAIIDRLFLFRAPATVVHHAVNGRTVGSAAVNANQHLDNIYSFAGSLFAFAMSPFDWRRLSFKGRCSIVLRLCRLFLDAGLDPHRCDGSSRTPFSIWADITAYIYKDEEEEEGKGVCAEFDGLLREMWRRGTNPDCASCFTPLDLGLQVLKDEGEHYRLVLETPRNLVTHSLWEHITGNFPQPDSPQEEISSPWREILAACRQEKRAPSCVARLCDASPRVPSSSALAALPSLPDGRPSCVCELCKQPDFSRLSLRLAAHSCLSLFGIGSMSVAVDADSVSGTTKGFTNADIAAVFPAMLHSTVTAAFDGESGTAESADVRGYLPELWGTVIDFAVMLEDVPALRALVLFTIRRLSHISSQHWFRQFGFSWERYSMNTWDTHASYLAPRATTPAGWEMLRLIAAASPCYPEGTYIACEACNSAAGISERCCAPWIAVQALPHVRSQGALQALLDAGVNLRRWEGSKALQEAVSTDNREGALLLVAAGAFPGRLIDCLRPKGEMYDGASATTGFLIVRDPTYLLAEVIHESGWARRRWAIGAREQLMA